MGKATRRQFVGGVVGSFMVQLPVLAEDVRRSRLFRLITGDTKLVAYWPLDGELEEWRGRGAAFTLKHGEPQFVSGAAGGKALALHNGAFLTVANDGRFDLQETSVELLFKMTQPPPTTYNPCIFALRTGHRETRFSVHVDRRTRQLLVWNGKHVFQFLSQTGPLQVGQWHHLVLTWSGKRREMRLYVDGLPARGTGRVNVSAVRLPFQVGASTPKGREACECEVDEVAIYARALNAGDVMKRVEAAGLAERSRKALAERERLEAERRRRDAQKLNQLLNDPRLLTPGKQRIYKDEHLTAVSLPLGGIGAGCLQINGKAQLKAWQIFGRFECVELPHSFLALCTRTQDGHTEVRALQTEPVGPFQPFPTLSFRGEYPFGWFDFQDNQLPVQVTLETFHPFIPLNAKDSALPCAFFNVSVTNRTSQPVEVSVLGSLQNAVGYDGHTPIQGRRFAGYGGNRNVLLRSNHSTMLLCRQQLPDGRLSQDGMALVCFDSRAEGTAGWKTLTDLQHLFAQASNSTPPVSSSTSKAEREAEKTEGKAESGSEAETASENNHQESNHVQTEAGSRLSELSQAGPSPKGETLDGALWTRVVLNPKETHTFQLALVWFFPNVRHGGIRGWKHRGQQYTNWWPNLSALCHYLEQHASRLTAQTRLYHDTVYSSNLPRWLLDRLTAQAAVLTSKTCFWAADGYFGGWEGCNATGGCCYGNCSHVWHYAQLHARLFPEIGRRMREQALAFQAPDGGIPFRQPAGKTATDGQCGDILGAYREHLCSPDRSWL